MAKNQALRQRLAELDEARAAIIAQCEPIQGERAKLWHQMEPLRRRWEELGQQIAAIEADGGLATICQEIAVLRRGLGTAGGMAAEPGAFGVEEGQS